MSRELTDRQTAKFRNEPVMKRKKTKLEAKVDWLVRELASLRTEMKNEIELLKA